jgi:DNA polymerase-3 subunit alpha
MLLPRTYSHHSLLSAVPKIPALIEAAKSNGYTSIALTDEDSGSGFVEFYDACKGAEINGILGVTLRIANMSKAEGSFGKHKQFSKVVVLARNEAGYRHILQLITLSRTQREKPTNHILIDDLEQYCAQREDLMVMMCGSEHEVGKLLQQGKKAQAKKIIELYSSKLGKNTLLFELFEETREGSLSETKQLNTAVVEFLSPFEVRPVFSPAPRYINPDDEESFRTVLAIRDGKRLNDITLMRDFHLKPASYYQQQYPEMEYVWNTEALESQFDISIRFDFDKHASEAYFPIFEMPENQNAEDRLKWESYVGLFTKYHPDQKTRQEWKEVYPYEKLAQMLEDAHRIQPDPAKLLGYTKGYWDGLDFSIYVERIEYELDIIFTKGYPDYFLVFGDIMQFCRDNSIVINTRGSAAGSLVGYLNDINILDPLLYKLPFERFLNPYRPSAPDIDGDFSDDRRGEVIDYITRKYGEDKVCQIITFGTMLPRAAVRDVGRVLGISYKKCDRLSKLIPTAPQGKKTTFAWAMEMSEELTQVYQRDEECNRIIEIAKKIEGNYRHASVHAAGVIIAPKSVEHYAPLQWDSDHQMIICQYDMRNAEKAGLIKMDILGIRNLAILGNAITLAEDRNDKKIDLLNVDINDDRSFELLAKGRTMGTFQLSGAAMTRYLVEMEPTKVQDLMAMVALYRPGPMGSIPDYIDRKKHPKKVSYIVPQMEDWMKESYGIFVYQEDVLFTAIELAGYDWGEADKIRKGLGKKIQAVIDEQHPKFVKGCVEKSGLTAEKAEEIWSLIVPFAAYGFNKSHSSSYGMVAYWTAYMKANYPAEFMTALMTAESSNLDKIAAAINECEELGLRVLPPDINKSFDTFSIEDDQTIRYGLSSVKNLGSDVIKFMIAERADNGEFESIEDFLARMANFQGFNKKSLEALIWSGSLDSLGSHIVETRKLKDSALQMN